MLLIQVHMPRDATAGPRGPRGGTWVVAPALVVAEDGRISTSDGSVGRGAPVGSATTMTGMDIATTAALLVIDVQQGFDDAGFWGPRDNPDAERNIAALLAAWQASGRPVVLVRHTSAPGRPLAAGAPGHAFAPVVAGARPALLVDKTVNSAFYGTPDLHAWLSDAGIEELVLCGIQTNMCVETTARMAGNLGYRVVVPIDATRTFDLAGPDGTVFAAADLSRATATNLHGGGFAEVTSTADVLARA